MNTKKIVATILIVGLCFVVFAIQRTASTGQGQTTSQQNTPQQVSLTFNSIPKGASVTIDGKSVGITPLTNIMTSAGMHHFAFSLTGFLVWEGNYAVFGQQSGLGVDFTGKLISFSNTIKYERNLNFINITSGNIVDDWWATTEDKMLFVVAGPVINGSTKNDVYRYDIHHEASQSIPHPFSVLLDSVTRQNLGIPARNDNDIFTAAYGSPSGQYILRTQHKDQMTLTFTLTDVNTNQSYPTNYQWSPSESYIDGDAYSPVWSTNEQLVWLDQYLHNQDPTIFWLQNGQLQTLHFTPLLGGTTLKSGVSLYDGGMYTRPSSQGYALIWGTTFDANGLETHAPYLLDLHTLIPTLLPVTRDDITSLTAMIFSPDGSWIYLGTKEGIKRINTQNLNDIELIDSTVSAANGYQVIDFSYTLDYAFVSSPGPNSNYSFYKMNKIGTTVTPNSIITPLAVTPTGGSAPGGNQVGG